MKQEELWIRSTADGTLQPSLFYRASQPNRPLLVGLHTWSCARDNQIKNMLPYAEEYDWNLLLPEFRGPNLVKNPNRPYACASIYAKQDVKDAIDYVLQTEQIDAESIFLLGLSGGGHMALMMAGFCPELFRAIGSYVPITDLSAWAKQNQGYAPHVLACCSDDEEQMRLRSPMSYIDNIAKANIKIFHGKYDPVVPVTHSLKLYNAIFEKYPTSRVFLDIFDGAHEIDMKQAMYWLTSQQKNEQNSKTEVTG